MKNLIIAGVVGVAFMVGGFFFGLHLKPIPVPPTKEAVAAAEKKAAAEKPPVISLDSLKKTSESMMSLNEALQTREQLVAQREQKVKEREDELEAERQALDRSHERFKALFAEFQQRLNLVEASQMEQLQKQAVLYESMGTTQSIDLIRAMDDASMVRLFSVMDVKPLGKLIAEWKTKYPEDTPRLLSALNGMAQVMPKEKIALADSPATDDSAAPATPDSSAAPATPAPAPDASAPDTTTTPTDSNAAATPPNSTPEPDPTTPAPTATTPTDAPTPMAPSDAAAPDAPATPPAPLTPPSDSTPTTPENSAPTASKLAGVSTATSN
jgi:hypothetical protein